MDLNFASGHDIRFDKNMEESYLELKEYFRNQNLTFHEKKIKHPLKEFAAMQRHCKSK
jgi:hypothetical protein